MTSRMRLYQSQGQGRLSAGPTTVAGWSALLDRAISRAAELKDRRLGGLAKAQSEGTAEKALRRMGILSEADIAREFPDLTPGS